MFVLNLIANNGEMVFLNFDTYQEALRMSNAFMNTGEYIKWEIRGKQ